MLLGKECTFEYGKVKFVFTPKHKFNFVCDKSATGKSYIRKLIQKSGVVSDFEVLSLATMSHFDFQKYYDKVFIIDEDQLYPVMQALTYKGFQLTPNCFLVFSRSIPAQISVDYRAIFVMRSKDRKYWLERKYPECQKFNLSKYILTEDSNSGYQYFKSRFKNTTHMNSKDDFFSRSLVDTTIVADGSAFGRDYPVVMTLEQTVSLFLPDSFEAMLVSYVDTGLARSIYKLSRTDDVLKYKSKEEFFNRAIQKVLPDYSKSKLPVYVKDWDIIEPNHCNVPATVASLNNVNRFDYYECQDFVRGGDLFNK